MITASQFKMIAFLESDPQQCEARDHLVLPSPTQWFSLFNLMLLLSRRDFAFYNHILEVMCYMMCFPQGFMSSSPASVEFQEIAQTVETNVCTFVCQIMRRMQFNMFSFVF